MNSAGPSDFLTQMAVVQVRSLGSIPTLAVERTEAAIAVSRPFSLGRGQSTRNRE